MDAFTKFFDAFSAVMATPALLLGIVASIGLIALKRPFVRVVSGFVKTAVGVLILQTGAGQIVGAFRPIIVGMKDVLGIEGVIIDPYTTYPAVQAAAEAQIPELLSWIGYTMVLAFAFNILLVALRKITKIRALFLTGHIMFLQSALMTWLVWYFFGLGQWPTIFISAVLVGLYWSIGATLNIKPTELLTDGAGFTVAHQQHLMNWVAWKIAPLFGDPKDSIDDLEFPGWLSVFTQDNVVTVPLIMLVFFTPILVWLGPQALGFESFTFKWFLAVLILELKFGVFVTIILTGVRMFVAELAVSFNGISEKLLPGAVVGVDGMAVAPYSPNSVIGGFVFAALGEALGVIILILTKSPILIIPGFVPVFFDAVITAVFANKFGGYKAVMIISFIVGLIHVFGSAWAASMSGLVGGWQGNSDFATVWPAMMTVMKLLSPLR
jgi:PTS system ascorbate-specific IIC component